MGANTTPTALAAHLRAGLYRGSVVFQGQHRALVEAYEADLALARDRLAGRADWAQPAYTLAAI